MPLIDIEKQGGSLSNKQMRNFKKYNDLQEGDGLFFRIKKFNYTCG